MEKNTDKFCKDCLFFKVLVSNSTKKSYEACLYRAVEAFDVVTGQLLGYDRTLECRQARRDDLGSCGIRGIWFKKNPNPKPETDTDDLDKVLSEIEMSEQETQEVKQKILKVFEK